MKIRKRGLLSIFVFVLLHRSVCSYAAGFKDYKLKVLESFPHDISGYTQGLFFHNGVLFESTGQYGSSTFRKVDLFSGNIESQIDFDSQYFIEGSCVIENRVYILTWYENTCFVYDIESFTPLTQFHYQGQGWGLTSDGNSLIMSNGSSQIVFRDPLTFFEQRSITVTLDGREITYLNELEYIDGKIWANVYGLDYILIIDPVTGVAEGRIDCRGLLEQKYRNSYVDVLNGIAYNQANGGVYLTGKYWPMLYKVALVEK